nr:Fic family protein [Anaerobacterium chartisolvens]
MSYKAFEPAPLPPLPHIKIDDEMTFLLSKAHRLVGRLDGISEQIPNIDLFVAMYVRKEALLSSQIEGTQATLDDILDPDIEENTNLDVADVVNYIKAMQFAISRLQELPLCNRLFKETHVVLMEGVRGQEKSPGEFRRSQNWIGPQGGNLKNAVFVPPTVEPMEKAMSDLEKFMNADDEIDPLIKAGLIHYQFETIHPFLDGNGRIGRMLITLWMIVQQLLKCPVLYISYFFKRNRIEYYDRLTDVRTKGHFEEWIRFFLNAVVDSASDACNTINELTNLHKVNYARIEALRGRKDTLFRLLNYIENNPIIYIAKTAQALGLQYNTVAKAVEKLVGLEIMKETTSFKRNRRFSYTQYLDYLRKDTQL